MLRFLLSFIHIGTKCIETLIWHSVVDNKEEKVGGKERRTRKREEERGKLIRRLEREEEKQEEDMRKERGREGGRVWDSVKYREGCGEGSISEREKEVAAELEGEGEQEKGRKGDLKRRGGREKGRKREERGREHLFPVWSPAGGGTNDKRRRGGGGGGSIGRPENLSHTHTDANFLREKTNPTSSSVRVCAC